MGGPSPSDKERLDRISFELQRVWLQSLWLHKTHIHKQVEKLQRAVKRAQKREAKR